jgi:GNAT superfamily N-acetyltransferase
MSMNALGLALRPIRPDDEPFLRRVYASTRLDELAPLGWSTEQRQAFLDQQFDAQHRHYQTEYSDADFLVILLDDRPIGRLYLARWPEEILLIDIALLPEHRGTGIGSRLIQTLLDEADQAGKPVRLHVEKFNQARRLYERLGFSIAADRGVYWFMERAPCQGVGRALRAEDGLSPIVSANRVGSSG